MPPEAPFWQVPTYPWTFVLGIVLILVGLGLGLAYEKRRYRVGHEVGPLQIPGRQASRLMWLHRMQAAERDPRELWSVVLIAVGMGLVLVPIAVLFYQKGVLFPFSLME